MRTKEEVIKIIEDIGYIYIDDYIENKIRRVVIQDNIGYKYDVQLTNLMRNHPPRFSDKNNPFTLSHNIPLWLKLNNSQFELLENNEYKGAFSKLNFYCKVCNDYPKTSWANIFIGQGCGICDGKQTGIYHNLEFQRPDIAKEWHPTKNGTLSPKNFTYSSNKKVHWLCPNGHEYFSKINDRTNGHGCLICSDSKKESNIANKLKSYILNKYKSNQEYKIIKNPDSNKWLPYDIYIYGGKDPKINGFYIEIHWLQHYKITWWHKKISKRKGITSEEEFEYQKYKDKLKKNFAKKNGIYIEVDLRKIKTTEQAIEYVENILLKTSL